MSEKEIGKLFSLHSFLQFIILQSFCQFATPRLGRIRPERFSRRRSEVSPANIPEREIKPAADRSNKTMKKTLPAIALITLLAFVLRLINIDSTPAGIYPDEAQNGWDAYLAWQSGDWRWFYPDNNGREGLFINLIGLSFAALGVSILALKLPSIIAGTLTVPGLYLLIRELFRRTSFSREMALAGAFFTAVSFWHINFSRIGFRAILLPLILVFSFWLLWRGLRLLRENGPARGFFRGAGASFFFSGLIFGLGLHTYIAFRVAPAILVVLLVALLIGGKFSWRELLKPAAVFTLGALISAAPMLWTFAQNPEYLSGRSSVSIFDPANNDGNLPLALGKTLTLSLGMFNFYGDQNWRHGFPPYPTLEPLTGVLFLIGLGVALLSAIGGSLGVFWRKFRRRKKKISLAVYWFLLAWFGLMLAPEFLTVEGLPHSLRAIGALPAVYIFAALGLGKILHKLQGRGNFRSLVVPITLTLMIYIGLFGALKYHIYWASRPEAAGAFNANLTAIARAVAEEPAETRKIVLAGPLERLPILLLNTQTKNLRLVYESEISSLVPTDEPVIIFTTDDWPHIVSGFSDVFGPLRSSRHYDPLLGTYFTFTPER